MKKVNIKLKEWEYECGDGCCYIYGTEIEVDDVKCDNQYTGDSVEESLKFVLSQLGCEVDIEREP